MKIRVLIDLPKDPWTGLKSSKAADRWASVIGWNTEADSQIVNAKNRTRNPPRLLAAISARKQITNFRLRGYTFYVQYNALWIYDLEHLGFRSRRGRSYEKRFCRKITSCELRLRESSLYKEGTTSEVRRVKLKRDSLRFNKSCNYGSTLHVWGKETSWENSEK